MKKFEGILFATDLDGTLVREDKTVPEGNLKAINYFMEQGGLFSIVTGRPPIGAVGIYNQIKPNAPCGFLNGGSIFDFEKGEPLWCREISGDALKLAEYVDKNLPNVGIEVHTHKNVYFCKPNCGTEEHKENEKLPDLYCHYYEVKESIAKVLFSGETEEDLPLLVELLSKHPMAKDFDFIRSDKLFYEVLPKGSSKADLVVRIANMSGISLDKIIAVGDNDNDASMLKTAKIGFAVSNATEYAKKSADYITVSNEECAIAKIIEQLDKGELDI